MLSERGLSDSFFDILLVLPFLLTVKYIYIIIVKLEVGEPFKAGTFGTWLSRIIGISEHTINDLNL